MTETGTATVRGSDGRTPTLVLASVMAVQALMGRIFHEHYRDDPLIAATWIGNDWVTLTLAVPILLAGWLGATRGSVRSLLLWLGMLAYAVYNYAFYLFGAALNAFFPLYVLAVVTATVTMMLTLPHVDVAGVARRFRPRTPVRLVGGSLLVIGIGLAGVWIAMWAAYIFAGRPTPIEPDAFTVVAALDLSLMLPVLIIGAVLLWRRAAWGYVLASVASIQGALYVLVLSVNSVVAIRRGLTPAPGELPVWGPLAVLTFTLAIVLLANVQDERAAGS